MAAHRDRRSHPNATQTASRQFILLFTGSNYPVADACCIYPYQRIPSNILNYYISRVDIRDFACKLQRDQNFYLDLAIMSVGMMGRLMMGCHRRTGTAIVVNRSGKILKTIAEQSRDFPRKMFQPKVV